MNKLIQKAWWYAPAETQIPWTAIFAAFSGPSLSLKASLCDYLNVHRCIFGRTARALLYRLLTTLKNREGVERCEVLIPGFTCYSVAAAVAKAGLSITVYDLDPATLYPDIDSLERATSEKTLAIVVQHLFGQVTPTEDMKRIARASGAYLIEDAAQALGRKNGEKHPGTRGDFGLFSFGRGKPLPIGGGGALVSNGHSKIMDEIRWMRSDMEYRQFIKSGVVKLMSKPLLYGLPEMMPLGLGETVFDLGFPVENIPTSVERMAVSALPLLAHFNSHRKHLARIYSENIDSDLQIEGSANGSSILRYPVMMGEGMLSSDLRRSGIRRMYPKAIADEKSIQPYCSKNGPTPGATEIAGKLITLPSHTGISSRTALEIAGKIHKARRQRQLVTLHGRSRM
jgi:perosamine synthetase